MNIVVNGGTKGIGREVVLALARDLENKVFVTGRSRDALNELTANHRNITSMVMDLSKIDEYSDTYAKAVTASLGAVDVMLNIAGLMIPKTFIEVSSSEARMMMETNFFGPCSAIKLLEFLMHKGTHIVNISSMGGFQGSSKYKGLSYYSASKAAIACMTECLAEEYRESGIKVNCLALGSVQTEMLEEAFPGYKAPVSAREMGEFIAEFALKGHKVFNGKILPVAVTNP